MRALCSAALLVLLAACSSPEDRARMLAEKQRAECVKRGLAEGTETFDACKARVREAQEKRKANRMAAFDDETPARKIPPTFRY